MLDSWSRNQSISKHNTANSVSNLASCCVGEVRQKGLVVGGRRGLTLFAGLVFNFSKIFCDCALVALIVGDKPSYTIVQGKRASGEQED